MVVLVTTRLGRNGRFCSRRQAPWPRPPARAREEIWPIIHGDRHELFGSLIARHQRDLKERWFHRLEQGVRLEQQDLRQAGARDSPVADRNLLVLPQALQLGFRPVDFERGDQALRAGRS